MTDTVPMLCEFDVKVHFKGSGMLGGTHEYDPYLSINASWGEYKKRAQWPLQPRKKEKRKQGATGVQVAQGEVVSDGEVVTYQSDVIHYRVPFNDALLKADESLWVEVFCRTRDFGVKELDERQSAYTYTHNTCGQVQLELYDLCRAYVENGRPASFRVHRPVLDTKTIKHKAQELREQQGHAISQQQWQRLVDESAAITQKGVLRFEVAFRHFDTDAHRLSVLGIRNLKTHCAHSLARAAVPESLGQPVPLLPQQQRAMDTRGRHGERSLALAEYEPLLFTSQRGQETLVERLQQHVLVPYCHHFVRLQETDPEPLHTPLNDNIAQLQLPIWVGKMFELPVATYWSSIDPVTREYANEEARQHDLRLYGLDGRAERYFTRLLTSSLRRHGMSAATFERVVCQHFALENKSRKLDPLFMVCAEVVADVGTFAANTAYYTADTRWMNRQRTASGKTFSSVMISLDSWDATLTNDEGRGDDCEGMDHAAMHVIRSFYYGRHDLGASWNSTLLRSVKLLLHHSVMIDLGGTVTSAFYDTNNQVVELKQDECPMVGSEQDLRSRSDGHCYGLMCPLEDTIRRLEAGNVGADVLDKMKAASLPSEEFKARDAQRQILLLEATGSIEPRILPLDETYQAAPQLKRKELAKRYFAKALRAQLKARKEDKSQVDLSQLFSLNGLPHYVEKQHPQRRISNFYNEIVHGASVDLWKRFDISLSQFAFARPLDKGRYQYGAKIADYLRAPHEYALVCPFYENRVAWEHEVVPVIEAVQHQIPIASFGRYTDEKFATLHSSYNDHTAITKDYVFDAKPETQESRDFDALVFSAAESDNLAVVHMQTRGWALKADEKRTQALWPFLDKLKGMVRYAVLTEDQLPAPEAILEIIAVIDVDVALTLKT